MNICCVSHVVADSTTVNSLCLPTLSSGKSTLTLINVASVTCLVGPSGLEPPTSRLSGARSNQLSYKPAAVPQPIFVVLEVSFSVNPRPWSLCVLTYFVIRLLGMEMMGFEPMTPCLQGRCSPNWATPPFNWVLLFSVFFNHRSGLLHSVIVSALSYFPVQSPVKYFHHCRA